VPVYENHYDLLATIQSTERINTAVDQTPREDSFAELDPRIYCHFQASRRCGRSEKTIPIITLCITLNRNRRYYNIILMRRLFLTSPLPHPPDQGGVGFDVKADEPSGPTGLLTFPT
jgi:hypothetical protein